MIEHYLSSNNKMCYNAKTQIFSPTKHTLINPGSRADLAGLALHQNNLFMRNHCATAVAECMIINNSYPLFFYSAILCLVGIGWGRGKILDLHGYISAYSCQRMSM